MILPMMKTKYVPTTRRTTASMKWTMAETRGLIVSVI